MCSVYEYYKLYNISSSIDNKKKRYNYLKKLKYENDFEILQLKKYEIKHEMSLLPTIRFYMSQSHVLVQSLRLQIIVVKLKHFFFFFFFERVKLKHC